MPMMILFHDAIIRIFKAFSKREKSTSMTNVHQKLETKPVSKLSPGILPVHELIIKFGR